MPSSARAILERRQEKNDLRVRHVESFEQFCLKQRERVERTAGKQLRRVRDARRVGAERAVKAAGCELEMRVRGCTGSDAHPDDEPEAVVLV